MEQGTYWTRPCKIAITDAHPRLLTTLKTGSALERVRLFVGGGYDMVSGAPIGQLEVAMDRESGLACGVFRSMLNGEDLSGKPVRFTCDSDSDSAIETVLSSARSEGLAL